MRWGGRIFGNYKDFRKITKIRFFNILRGRNFFFWKKNSLVLIFATIFFFQKNDSIKVLFPFGGFGENPDFGYWRLKGGYCIILPVILSKKNIEFLCFLGWVEWNRGPIYRELHVKTSYTSYRIDRSSRWEENTEILHFFMIFDDFLMIFDDFGGNLFFMGLSSPLCLAHEK